MMLSFSFWFGQIEWILHVPLFKLKQSKMLISSTHTGNIFSNAMSSFQLFLFKSTYDIMCQRYEPNQKTFLFHLYSFICVFVFVYLHISSSSLDAIQLCVRCSYIQWFIDDNPLLCLSIFLSHWNLLTKFPEKVSFLFVETIPPHSLFAQQKKKKKKNIYRIIGFGFDVICPFYRNWKQQAVNICLNTWWIA